MRHVVHTIVMILFTQIIMVIIVAVNVIMSTLSAKIVAMSTQKMTVTHVTMIMMKAVVIFITTVTNHHLDSLAMTVYTWALS